MSISLGQSGFAPATTRGRILGSGGALQYPSPFFDIAHTYLPPTVRALFRWCRYYFLTNPLINATIFKLSEYPITDVVVEHDDPQVVSKWQDYLQDDLNYDTFRLESGLDYFTYGNVYVSILYPFVKYLQCTSCKSSFIAKDHRKAWQFASFEFRLTCPSCRHVGSAKVSDLTMHNPKGARLMRWNPEDVEVSYQDLTGETTYYYNIPTSTKNDVVLGRKEVLEGMPQAYIQAIKEQKGIVFSKDNFFHLKRPSLATTDRGYGTPLMLPVLKDTFYLQIMKKAQESLLLDHVVPLRVLFPQAGSGTSDPYTTISLTEWRDHVSQEIARWRQDPNYIPIMPLPLGNQTIGGDGRQLLLAGEIAQWSEHIMMGLGVPREFLLGGLSWAGTNVSLRMLENSFVTYLKRQDQLLKWIVRRIHAAYAWPLVKTRFKPFKMADDLQRKALLFQMNQASKISDTTLLGEFDLEMEEENKIMQKESKTRMSATKAQQLAMAEIQGESQLSMTKWQVKAQQVMAEAQAAQAAPGEPGDAAAGAAPADPMQQMASPLGGGQSMAANGNSGGLNILAMAKMQAESLAALPPDQQQVALANLQAQNPELADLVASMLKQMQAKQQAAGVPGVDGSALPEQSAPRRAGASI
jgi:hypothetical protein